MENRGSSGIHHTPRLTFLTTPCISKRPSAWLVAERELPLRAAIWRVVKTALPKARIAWVTLILRTIMCMPFEQGENAQPDLVPDLWRIVRCPVVWPEEVDHGVSVLSILDRVDYSTRSPHRFQWQFSSRTRFHHIWLRAEK